MGELLLSEELLLIGLHDETGKADGWFDPSCLHGALVCDLIGSGAVTVDDRKKLHPGERAPEHPALRKVYDVVAADSTPRTVSHWMGTLPWKHTKPARSRCLRRPSKTSMGTCWRFSPMARPGPVLHWRWRSMSVRARCSGLA